MILHLNKNQNIKLDLWGVEETYEGIVLENETPHKLKFKCQKEIFDIPITNIYSIVTNKSVYKCGDFTNIVCRKNVVEKITNDSINNYFDFSFDESIIFDRESPQSRFYEMICDMCACIHCYEKTTISAEIIKDYYNSSITDLIFDEIKHKIKYDAKKTLNNVTFPKENKVGNCLISNRVYENVLEEKEINSIHFIYDLIDSNPCITKKYPFSCSLYEIVQALDNKYQYPLFTQELIRILNKELS